MRQTLLTETRREEKMKSMKKIIMKEKMKEKKVKKEMIKVKKNTEKVLMRKRRL